MANKFFRLILGFEHCCKEQLRLPHGFVSHYGFELGVVAFLKVFNDEPVEVKLKAEGRCLYFTDGWTDFYEKYGLSKGHFLVFKYKGNGAFKVTLFDTSCLSVSRNPTTGPAEANPPISTASAKANRPTSSRAPQASPTGNRAVARTKRAPQSHPKHPPNERDSNEIAAALKRATTYIASCSNPCFAGTMLKSHLTQSGGLNIPKKFAELNLKGGIREVQLEAASHVGTWAMKCSLPCPGVDSVIRVKWRDFTEVVGLVEGDACVVELVDASLPKFRVSIFRA